MLFLRWLRGAAESPNRFVPFIMLSGAADNDYVTASRDLGTTEFLAKPFSAQSVYRRLLEVIDRPRQFITNNSYFGPDRRRQNLGPPRGIPERRKEEIEKMAEGAAADGLSQQEIESLLDK